MKQNETTADDRPQPVSGGQAANEALGRRNFTARLVLLRHGEPNWFPDGEQAVLNAGLTDFGAAQARAAAGSLATHPIDAIYVSPLRRAQETAAPLAEATGITPVTVEGLSEIQSNVGRMTQQEVDRFFVEAMGRPHHEFWDGFPGGESFHDFHSRVTAAVRSILDGHGMKPEASDDFTIWHGPDGPLNIVVVAHGGTNAVLTTHLLDVRPLPWEWIRFEMELAGYTVLQARPIGDRGSVWSLVNFNEVDPLRNAGLR